MKKIGMLFLFCVFYLSAQQTVIKGKLLDADGKPMLLAHVHLIKPLEKESISNTEVGKDGSFSLATTEKEIVMVKCSGVNHIPMEIPLFLDPKERTIELSIQLRTYKYVNAATDIAIIGNMFNTVSETKNAMKQADGTWKAEFISNADTFAYEVKGVCDRSINGTQSDLFRYDGDGDYQSLVIAKKGQPITITIDPKKFFIRNAGVKISVKDKKSLNAKLIQLNLARQERTERFMDTIKAYQKSGRNLRELAFDWSKDSAALTAQMAKEKAVTARQLLLFSYGELKLYAFRNADQKIINSIPDEIPPSSVLWNLNPTVIQAIFPDPEKYDAFVSKLVAENHYDGLRSVVLFTQMQMAKYMGKTEKFKECYTKLTTDFANTMYGKMTKERFKLEPEIAVGKIIPSFSVVSLEDSTKIYSSDSLRGRIFMIDFWATWCGPCIGEMENLHKAYEKFKGKKGFEVLSMSYDKSKDDIAPFRRDKWKMPWLHTFLEGNFGSEIGKKFEVQGIPKPILVDVDGKILAMEGDLRGENLEKTLARFLGE